MAHSMRSNKGEQMSVIDNFMIEVTFKKKRFDKIPEQFEKLVEENLQYESDERIVLDLPLDWSGLKDGTVFSLLKYFGDAVYLALAYITGDNSAIVVDTDGKPVDRYPIVLHGMQMTKYVKKRLRVVHVLNKEENIFQVEEYILDLDSASAVVKVLSVYSAGKYSRFRVEDFVKR